MATQIQKDNLNRSLSYKLVDSPIGALKLVASEKGLVAVLGRRTTRDAFATPFILYSFGLKKN